MNEVLGKLNTELLVAHPGERGGFFSRAALSPCHGGDGVTVDRIVTLSGLFAIRDSPLPKRKISGHTGNVHLLKAGYAFKINPRPIAHLAASVERCSGPSFIGGASAPAGSEDVGSAQRAL
jgi:hypothetical protein